MIQEEAEARLNAIAELLDHVFCSDQELLVSTQKLLKRIHNIALANDDYMEEPSKLKLKPDHIVISCDASITKNPGGEVAIGAIIEWPRSWEGMVNYQIVRKMPKSNTNNQGEYDAIYIALTDLMNLRNNPGCEIEVRSDSKLVIDQLNGKISCKDKELQRRRKIILETIQAYPVPVKFVWRPRNSTPALEAANYLAQDALGVSRH